MSSSVSRFAFDAPSSHGPAPMPAPARRRGRPPLATREQVIEQIRAASQRGELFRVHLDQPSLYARARRLWGTWAGALAAAGLDHSQVIATSRRRAIESRRSRRAAV